MSSSEKIHEYNPAKFIQLMKKFIVIALLVLTLLGNTRGQTKAPEVPAGDERIDTLGIPIPNPLAKFSVGLETGYTRNYLITNISSLPFTTYKPVGGFSIGVPLQYRVTEWFSLYSDPNMTKKNYEYARTDFFQGVHETYSNTYLQVPLTGRFLFGGQRLKGFVNGGFYGAYWAFANVKGTLPNPLNPTNGTAANPKSIFDELNPYSFDEKYSFNDTKDNRIEFGWILGAGISYQLTESVQLFLEGRNTQGLTDQQKQYMTNQIPKYNQTYGASIGFLLNLRKRGY
jgi:opacity protein-like surface antigen